MGGTGKKRSTDKHGHQQTLKTDDENQAAAYVSASPCSPLSSACLAANAALSLLNLATYLLDRQVERLAIDFEKQGGFTERLYKIRSAKRKEHLGEADLS
ncbi:four helix bundle suffix domain-containing protein [Chitinispirillales bacterium ANBcel5]|uniref:four helix bundle suffix domain-containing protein n=1 Tax=Cellulosispirillum alkaliphilum TaxID=3039283 RepID=UPI002A4EBD8B|nr:four helix bundle suffix domain-containing protein [Chitinispirillales bacterium ANBcel5]